MKRESFIFYRSFYEAIRELSDDIKLEVLNAVCEYGLNGEDEAEIEFNIPTARALFSLMKPQLDANNKRFMNGLKGAEAGKKGGRPRKDENPETTETKTPSETPKKPQENPTQTPNVNVNVNVNDNDKESIEKGETSSPTRTRFTKPSLEDLSIYVRENNLQVDVKRFYDYYESCGWKVGNKPMKDWQATARNWSRTELQKQAESKSNVPPANALFRNGGDFTESKF